MSELIAADLHGVRALATGGSSGLGRAMAEALVLVLVLVLAGALGVVTNRATVNARKMPPGASARAHSVGRWTFAIRK